MVAVASLLSLTLAFSVERAGAYDFGSALILCSREVVSTLFNNVVVVQRDCGENAGHSILSFDPDADI